MFGLNVIEVAVLLLWAIGITCALVGTFTGVFSVREAIVAIAIALFIPIIGSVGAILLYVIRRAAVGTHATP
jgi:hypothetical protein